MMFKIAFRSIFRNRRRSLMTMLTIAVGTAAMLVFGAYVTYVTYGLQTSTVQRSGHLTVYRNGYFNFGTGNPALWGIHDYPSVVRLIRGDPELSPMVAVVTPVQALAGIAGNFDKDQSRTFFGTGFVPSERDRMKRWSEYGVGSLGLQHSGLKDADATQGIIGNGLARILGLCERLHLDNCPAPPKNAPTHAEASAEVAALPSQDFSGLQDADHVAAAASDDAPPRIDLLAATAGGAPNVVNLEVRKAESQGVRELDDAYVGMNITLAQQLIYGRGEHRATGIVVQLHRTEDMEKARARLNSLFKAKGLDLEVRDFTELNPFYLQALNLFRSIFSFISVIIGVVVLFTVSNAMGMSVIERTDEIGTTRALGVRRSGVRQQFLLEGVMLGLMGATLGVLAAVVISYVINGAHLDYTPPGQAQPVPLRLYLVGAPVMVATVWGVLTVLAAFASFLPANRAAKLQIVDALRHV
ncbi:MAG: ABC transporter permease [Phenylobacterium sp.]